MHFLAEEAEHNPILPIWQEIVVGFVAFMLLVGILGKFVWPKMEETFQARVDAIEGGLKRAEARQAEADTLLEQYKQQLAQARAEAGRIRDEARADAVGIREEMLARAREESERVISAGRDALSAERETISRQLRSELGALAVDLAGRIVAESLVDEARQRGTVQRFLAELDDHSGESVTSGGGKRL